MTAITEEEELISEEQNGFRKNRRGTEILYILKELIEEAGKGKKKLYTAYSYHRKSIRDSKQTNNVGISREVVI